MQYRKMGKTGVEVSPLGFGAMRLPLVERSDGVVDEDRAIAMIRYAIDSGVNYLDTAYPYHKETSEGICGRALEDGYRDNVYLADKMPSWLVKEPGDMERFLDIQLERLGVDCIDFYLLHTLTEESWARYKKLDYQKFLLEAQRAGKIKHLGFSFHAHIDLFKEIVDDFEWDFCQIQLNYLDENYQAGLEGMGYASERGLGVIVMEPLRGGMLAREEIPEDLKAIWKEAPVKRTPAAWGLSSVFNYSEVSVVLSGMSTMEQLEQNLVTAEGAVPGFLSPPEIDTIGKARDFFKSRIRVDCTNCRYCMPCPAGVNIPELFWAYNHEAIFDDSGKAKFWATGFISKEARAFNCVECGQCEEHCPQNIAIIENLKLIDERYGRGE